MGFGVESLNRGALSNYKIAVSKFDGENSTADFFVNGGTSSVGNSNSILNISETDRQKLQALFKNLLHEQNENKPLSIADVMAILDQIIRKISQPDSTMPKEVAKDSLADLFNPRSSKYPDYVPINSSLGGVLSRPQADCRPIDRMYKPVYGENALGERRIVGYRKITEQEQRKMFYQLG